ncbi:MAG: amidohydrolase [Pseudomonadota bacterium]
MDIIPSLIHHFEEDAARRRDIHAHPELAFEEQRTAALVAQQLEAWGIETHRGIGGSGVVGVIRRGAGARGVALRADMDALPITEANRFGHASRHVGKMHACGHDGHTATLLAAARVLAQEGRFDGRVVLVFQPAEETSGGAKAMIEDGLFDRFPADAIFGFHNRPGLALGHFTLRPGPSSGALVDFKVTLEGKGCHAAMPHLGTDPVPVACQMVQGFQTIVSRNKRPIDAGLISVTMIDAGEATNVVSSQCVVQGTARCASGEVLEMVRARMQDVAQHTAAAHGMDSRIEWSHYCPPVVNHLAEAAFLRQLMVELAGPDKVHLRELTMGGEDFGYYLQVKPGSYFGIGIGDGTHRQAQHGQGPCTLHNASYDFNDALIPIGATFWVRLAERFLASST